MRIECTCGAIVKVEDADVERYVAGMHGKSRSERKAAANRIKASRPRPGGLGNQHARKKEVVK